MGEEGSFQKEEGNKGGEFENMSIEKEGNLEMHLSTGEKGVQADRNRKRRSFKKYEGMIVDTQKRRGRMYTLSQKESCSRERYQKGSC